MEAATTLPDTARPPRDDLFRAVQVGVDLTRAENDRGPVMSGHFAVFNQYTEIDSMFEGNFLERFAPGAFKKTMRENRDGMRVLFQHGFDHGVGEKPLGPIGDLREDDTGAYYEVPLLDARYVRDDVLPGLEENLYGASFRFRVVRELWENDPGVSDDNPKGLPQRTIKEVMVMEFGPVTFPAYAGATAGVRSLTDELLLARFAREPDRLRDTLNSVAESLNGRRSSGGADTTTETDDAGTESHLEREEPPADDAVVETGSQDEATEEGAGTESHPDRGSRDSGRPLRLPTSTPRRGVLPNHEEDSCPIRLP